MSKILDQVIFAVNESNSAPQPEGADVVRAYNDGLLPDECTMLYVIAALLRRCNSATTLVEELQETIAGMNPDEIAVEKEIVSPIVPCFALDE